MKKERIYEMLMTIIRDIDMWGLTAAEAQERIPYINGLMDMATEVCKEIDKEEAEHDAYMKAVVEKYKEEATKEVKNGNESIY